MKIVKHINADNFVDRDIEKDEIIKEIYDDNSSKIHIIYSKTAIGKSALTTKILNNIQKFSCIRVSTSPENNSSNSTEWLYIDLIFKKIYEYFKKSDDLNFETYCRKDELINKQINEILLNKFLEREGKSRFLSPLIYYIISRCLKINEFNIDNILSENTEISRRIKIKYIQYILSNQKIVLCIDNIQNIDKSSLKYLIDWVNETKKMCHYFLFEYTISDNHKTKNILLLAEQFSNTGVLVKYSELNRLPSEYAVDVVNQHFENKPDDFDFNIKVLNYFRNSDGNIRELLDFTICFNNLPKGEPNPDMTDPTFIHLNELNEKSQYILATIIYNNGIIDERILCEILKIDIKELQNNLSELKQNFFVKYDNGYIYISHASIVDNWQKNIIHFKATDDYVCHIVEKFYLTQLYKNHLDFVPTDMPWQILLQIYAKHNPKEIEKLLNQLYMGAVNNISQVQIWKYLKILIDCTQNRINDLQNLYFRILSMCFDLELYEEGFNCLVLMEKNFSNLENEKLLLHKSMYYAALDKHNENISLYETSIKKLAPYEKAYINLSLIVLCSYRSLNKNDECLKIHHDLLNNKNIKSKKEYAFFLRLTNIYLSDNVALKYAKKSIEIFREIGDLTQSGKSMITYAKLLSGLGKNNQAINVILKAEKLLQNTCIGQHMIFTNYAAFLLMKGIYDDNVWDLLNKAECSAKVPYDKLAIIVNKLVWCFENKKYDRIDLLISNAKNIIPNEPDKHVHILIYYNLYLIFSDMKNKKKAAYYYDLAYEDRNKCDFVKARIDGYINKDMKYRIKHPWHICYLSFWTYNVSDCF